MAGKRLKILRLSPDLLVDLLSLDGSKRIKIEGMPPDAKILDVSLYTNFTSDEFAFRVESQSFPEVPAGSPIPVMYLLATEMPDPSPDCPVIVGARGRVGTA